MRHLHLGQWAAMTVAQAKNLAAGYGRVAAIEGVSFTLAGGSRIGVLGPNGGGKTTLFRAILGQLRPLDGTIEVPARCATVPQTERSRLDYPVSAADVAGMGSLTRLAWWQRPGRHERAAALAALDRVGLAERAGEPFGDLSAGQRQRVLIARALVAEAGLLLLDEPFTGLDSVSSLLLEELIGDLAAEGRCVLIATHDLEQARGWDLVLCLNRSQVGFGPPEEVLTREVLEATYGGQIVEIPGGEGRRGILPPHHHHQHGATRPSGPGGIPHEGDRR
jgi:ABC-type Mn2+/Zn2+ transport system ATPase subunit